MRSEPSSFALTVTLCAVVDEVRVAVYVPLPLFVTAPSAPSVTASVTVPPPVERFVPAAFFNWTVIVEVDEPLAVIEVGDANTIDCASEPTALIAMLCAETEPRRL